MKRIFWSPVARFSPKKKLDKQRIDGGSWEATLTSIERGAFASPLYTAQEVLGQVHFSIHHVRLIGALLVIAAHYGPAFWGQAFYSNATSIFFLVSGFTGLRPGRNAGRLFITRRLVRLYPAWVVAILGYGVLYALQGPSLFQELSFQTLQEGAWVILDHLTFFLFSNGRPDVFTLNPAFWSLPVFLTFYLLMTVLSTTYTPRLSHVLILAIIAQVAFATGLAQWRQAYMELWAFPLHLYAFWLGGWLFRLCQNDLTQHKGYTWGALLMLLSIVACGWHFEAIMAFLPNDMVFRQLMVVQFACFLWCSMHSDLIQRRYRLLSWLGQLGFGLYLFHNAPLTLIRSVTAMTPEAPLMLRIIATLTALAATVLLAWGVSRFIERPLHRRWS